MNTHTTIIEKFREKLLAFLNRHPHFPNNCWLTADIEETEIQVYLRNGSHRVIAGQQVKTLDIANITVEPMGTGLGTEIINLIHELNPYPVTYIENVLNGQFATHLSRNNWITKDNCIPPSFYKTR